MTYRDRRLRRAERLRGWAEKRQQTAAATFRQGDRYRGDHAFNTQPGHIPERARLIAREDGAHASLRKAASMDSRADEIERQADRAIYDDDADAIEQLRERIATLEARRERIRTANKAIRRHGLQRLIEPDPPFALTDDEKRELLMLIRVTPYHRVETRGFPAYWNGPPTTDPPTTADAECPICEGTAIQAIQLAGGDHRIEQCDVCRGAGRMPATEAAAIEQRLRDIDAEARALHGLPPCNQ